MKFNINVTIEAATPEEALAKIVEIAKAGKTVASIGIGAPLPGAFKLHDFGPRGVPEPPEVVLDYMHSVANQPHPMLGED